MARKKASDALYFSQAQVYDSHAWQIPFYVDINLTGLLLFHGVSKQLIRNFLHRYSAGTVLANFK